VKALRNPWVTGVLALVAVLIVFYNVVLPQMNRGRWRTAPRSTPAPTPAATQAQAAVAPTNLQAWALPPTAMTNLEAVLLPAINIERVYVQTHFDNWVKSPPRDPFLLLPAADTSGLAGMFETNSPLAHLKLHAIWDQTDSRLAVINQDVYAVGDQILGYKIIKIQSDEVWLQGTNRNERLGFDKNKARLVSGSTNSVAARK
jgi:hypothetical protein